MPCPASNSRCSCDFSTRAPLKPNLSSIEVVSDIFYKAARKAAQRYAELASGTMSPEEVTAAQARLTDWIGATFSGGNRHYASSEDWNPRGLAEFARGFVAEEIREKFGSVPREDTEVVFALSRLYVKDLEGAIERHVASGEDVRSFPLSAASISLVNWWARLMTGAPLETLLHL